MFLFDFGGFEEVNLFNFEDISVWLYNKNLIINYYMVILLIKKLVVIKLDCYVDKGWNVLKLLFFDGS